MRPGKRYKSVCVAAVSAMGLWPGAMAREPSASRPASTRPAALLNVTAAPDRAGGLPVAGLSGRGVSIALVGPAKGSIKWEFAYRQDVLKRGQLRLGADGFGTLGLILPEVRHRTECSLMASCNGKTSSRVVVIFPSSVLASRAKRIKAWRLGVFDETGRVERALKAEAVFAEGLGTRLAQDVFGGGGVILAGFRRGEALSDACRRLDERLRTGMSLVILNPPAGWKGQHVRLRELPQPVSCAVHLARSSAEELLPADLGTGPWRLTLAPEPDDKPLIWIETRPPPKDPKAKPAKRKYPLVLARRIGRGWLIVSVLPQTADPADDPAGRAVLNRLILWILTQRGQSSATKENEA